MNIYVKKIKNTKGNIKEELWVNFMLDNKRVRKSLKLLNTKANWKIAENDILPTLKYKLLNGELKKETSKMPTVNEYMEVSFELNEGERCGSTIYGHRKAYDKYIKNIFGFKKLDKITTNEITLWQNSLQKNNNLSKSYIVKIRGLLNTMFEDSIEENILQFNPIKKVKSLKETANPKVNRQKLIPFKIEEINKILNSSIEQDKNIIATLFFTGLRAGELIGLKWDCIDFENKTISIRKQIVNGEIKSILKTSKSQRIIPIIDSLIPFLKEQYKLTGNNNSFVFLTKRTNKHYHSAGKLREQIWIKAIEKTDVPYRNLHQTRGTFISTLISNGEDINYVSKIAGHENVKITLERYSEYIPVAKKDFGKCFNKVLDNSGTKLTPNKKSNL
ncbi:MAG: tyrosine-type recombinase/integrase [Campylobacterota bacterium]|nr:tyrosine-type recombinase/integrase [Campylobacterota bacterium]